MIIRVEKTTDENVCNFYLDGMVLSNCAVECTDIKSLKNSPLADVIFDIGDITRVLIAQEMVSVKKVPGSSWDDLSPQIMAQILDFVATGAPMVLNDECENNDDILWIVLSLIDARIRPALNKDGGDIEIKKYEDGVLEVELTGKCAGCPYAMRTLKDGVEKILKNYIPQIKEVKPYKNG